MPRPRVKQADVVFELVINVEVLQRLLCLPAAVVQVQKARSVDIAVQQVNVGWIEVAVHYLLAVEHIEQVNDLNGNPDCFKLREDCFLEGHAFVSVHRVFVGCCVLCIGQQTITTDLDALTLLGIVVDVLLESDSWLLLDLSIDDLVWQLAKIKLVSNSWVIFVEIQKQSLSPQVLEKTKLVKFQVVNHKEVEYMRSVVVEDSFRFHPEAVVDAKQKLVVHELVPVVDHFYLQILAGLTL